MNVEVLDCREQTLGRRRGRDHIGAQAELAKGARDARSERDLACGLQRRDGLGLAVELARELDDETYTLRGEENDVIELAFEELDDPAFERPGPGFGRVDGKPVKPRACDADHA